MGIFVTIGVRIAMLVAIWQAWGWVPAILVLAALIVIREKKTAWSEIDSKSVMTWVRIALEVAVFVTGLIAVNTAWGSVWAVGLLVVYVIGFVSH